jgi:hypothetical protein
MAITTQEFKRIGSQMDKMRNLIQKNPQQASELFYEHPELYKQIKEIVILLRELQEDAIIVENSRPKSTPESPN